MDEEKPTEHAVSAWALSHARELSGAGDPVSTGKARVELLTDPWSVWCWGFEPVRRALEARYPTIEFEHRLGGMFERLPDPEEMEFEVARFFAVVQRTTGMPIRLDVATRRRPKSTFPACIHAHAVRLVDPSKERLYLRRLREAVYLDGLDASDPDVAATVAEGVGVTLAEFREALGSGEAEREFAQALAAAHAEGLHAYPTYTIRTASKAARVEGFQTLPALLAIIETVTGRLHPARATPPAALDVVPPGERVATREVAEAVGRSLEQTFEELVGHERAGALVRERHPGGDVWSKPR
ncbi:MAG TPA: DsbA family protein [Candidatus Thermoplasmatota archaeon]|nr:DsbA family protein [Candidatus Thermoplasmatota archaeon]